MFSNKILVFWDGIHKTLVRIANREDPDQIWVCFVCPRTEEKTLISLQKQSDLGLLCLSLNNRDNPDQTASSEAV